MNDFAVFIGRFQPLHLGHQHNIDQALAAANTVIILVGSSGCARSITNPFTYDERVGFIESAYHQQMKDGRVIVTGLADRAYNDDAWVAEVQRIVNEIVLDVGNSRGVRLHGLVDFTVGLAGYEKDGTSFYLKKFPEWRRVPISRFGTFNSTDIRADYFRRSPLVPHDMCSEGVVAFLKDFRLRDDFAALVDEREYLEAYKASWAGSPFPPTFVTVDCVVIQSGHVLLVRRRGQPGQGLLAIPGGFLGQDEALRAAAVRELREETGITDNRGPIPPAVLASFIDGKGSRVFDAPRRSARGRTITHAFLFRCPDQRELFYVKGADDALSASWHRFGDLHPQDFFEDHWHILEEMIGI